LDDSGAEIGRRFYDAFGVIIAETGSWPVDFAYQTNWLTITIGAKKWALSPTRLYDFVSGRFMQGDLLLSSAHLYLYSNNNPLNQLDPDGQDPINEKIQWDEQKPKDGPVPSPNGGMAYGDTSINTWNFKMKLV